MPAQTLFTVSRPETQIRTGFPATKKPFHRVIFAACEEPSSWPQAGGTGLITRSFALPGNLAQAIAAYRIRHLGRPFGLFAPGQQSCATFACALGGHIYNRWRLSGVIADSEQMRHGPAITTREKARATPIGSLALLSSAVPMTGQEPGDHRYFLHAAIKISNEDTPQEPGWIQVAALNGPIIIDTLDQTLDYYKSNASTWTRSEVNPDDIELRIMSQGDFSRAALAYVISGDFRSDVYALRPRDAVS